MIMLSEFEKRFKAKGFDLVGNYVSVNGSRQLILSHHSDMARIWVKGVASPSEERITKSFWEVLRVRGSILRRSPATLLIRFVPRSERP